MRIRTLLPLLVLAAACSESTTEPGTDDALALDVATVVADAALADLADFDAAIATAGPNGASSAADGVFERTRSVTFLDGNGAEMDGFDPLLTATIVRTSSSTRSGTRGGLEVAVERARDLTISGLLGEETERTFDGAGSDDHSRTRFSDAGQTRSYVMSSSVEIRSVVRAVDRTNQPWPLSGSIAREVMATRTGGPNGDVTRSRSTVLTFDGTQYATLTVDGETFTVDLGARGGANPVSRGSRGGNGG